MTCDKSPTGTHKFPEPKTSQTPCEFCGRTYGDIRKERRQARAVHKAEQPKNTAPRGSAENPILIVNVEHVARSQGKGYATSALRQFNTLSISQYAPEIINGRWMGVATGKTTFLDDYSDRGRMVKAILTAIAQQTTITTQRNIYYSIRGAHPEWTYNGKDLKDDSVYTALTGSLMEDVQLITQHTMQSLGVWASPRGYVTGDGNITTATRGTIPLRAKPTLGFDLVDSDVTVDSKAHKVIHFEKDAGFEGLASIDNCIMLEAQFSTAQGYPTESANKFLADSQKRGMNVFVVHDADPHGIQMQLMYGMSSKNSCYMPNQFYPKPKSTILLGLFPSIAQALELPAEEVSDTSRKIIPNLEKLVVSHPDMREELDVIVEQNEQWEFQALSGLSPDAMKLYLIEALLSKGDEIKYVPKAEEIKETMINNYKFRAGYYVDHYINQFIDNWFNKADGLKAQIFKQIKEKLKEDIKEFDDSVKENIEALEDTDAEAFREHVKRELVDNPVQYATDVIGNLHFRLPTFNFEVTADLNVEVKMENIKVEKEATVELPDEEAEPMTKIDIANSIAERMSGDSETTEKLRQAFTTVFGEVDVTW